MEVGGWVSGCLKISLRCLYIVCVPIVVFLTCCDLDHKICPYISNIDLHSVAYLFVLENINYL